MAEFVGSWVRLVAVDVVVVGVVARLVSSLPCMGATPARAVMVESAKANRILEALSKYIVDLFLSGTY